MAPQPTRKGRMMNKSGTLAFWQTNNPRLLKGEFAIVDVGGGRYRMKIGNGIDRFNTRPFFDESAGAFMGTAQPSTYPPATPDNIWYFAGPGTYTNFLDGSSNPITVSSQLAVLSRVSGVWSKLDIIAEGGYLENRRIIKQGGTIGVDCDATDFQLYITDITDATITNRYIVEVLPGDYEISGGLYLRDYISIEGHPNGTADSVVIRSDEAPSGAAEVGDASIYANARCTVRNVFIVGYKNNYCIKFESATDRTSETIFENCRIQHFGGADPNNGYRDLWAMMKYSQKLRFIDCVSLSPLGMFVTNNPSLTDRNNNYAFTFSMQGCKTHVLAIGDYLQYTHDRIELVGNELFYLVHGCYDTVYTANPGVDEANRGFYPNPTTVIDHNNRIGIARTQGIGYKAITGRFQIYREYNTEMQNTSGSNIPEGIAVIAVADAAQANAYTYGDDALNDSRMTRYAGGTINKVVGFTQEQINNGELGAVRYIKNSYGIIKASFDTANGAVVYGDEIQLQANGQVAKLSAGTAIGYAYDANGGGFVDFVMYR